MRPFAVEKKRFPASSSFKSGKGICAMKRILVFFCIALLLLSACATPPMGRCFACASPRA
ncbi:MAG: hypothetical protein DBX63_02390 [Clostridia bacterium]|nr:MAG: hypothetical protein DBX63_02390 [Clostridia bacterium]